MNEAPGSICGWCEKGFTPRRDGGKRQVFCRPACRRAFDAAGRRFVAEAITCGLLSLDQIRNGAAATRALLPGAISPAPITPPHPVHSAAPVAPPERCDDAADRLDEFSWSHS